MTLNTLSEGRATTTGWTHGSNENDILDLHEILGKSTIPAFVIHPLTKNLNRGLCTVFFLLRHVKIINEEDQTFSYWRTVNTFTALLNFTVDGVLGKIC